MLSVEDIAEGVVVFSGRYARILFGETGRLPFMSPESLLALVERCRTRMEGVLRNKGIPPEDAEDVLQETLLALHTTRWENVRAPEGATCWAFCLDAAGSIGISACGFNLRSSKATWTNG